MLMLLAVYGCQTEQAYPIVVQTTHLNAIDITTLEQCNKQRRRKLSDYVALAATYLQWSFQLR